MFLSLEGGCSGSSESTPEQFIVNIKGSNLRITKLRCTSVHEDFFFFAETVQTHAGKSATILESNHGSGVCMEHYA